MEKSRAKETILVITVGFIILFFIFDKIWLLYISLGIGVAGLISVKLSEWIHHAWFWLAEKLGWFLSRVILSLIYFLVLLPVGYLAKLFRKDFMFLKKRTDSYYIERNKVYEAKDFNDPW
jgi:hypothetical protein